MVAKFQPLNHHVKQQTRFKTRAKGRNYQSLACGIGGSKMPSVGDPLRIVGSGLAVALLLWPVNGSGTPAGMNIWMRPAESGWLFSYFLLCLSGFHLNALSPRGLRGALRLLHP